MVAVETEAKLVCGPDFVERELLGWLARRGDVSGPVELQQQDTYLDTRTDELVAAGLAVRVRDSAGLRTVELKPVPIERSLVLARSEFTCALRPGEDAGERVRTWVAELFGLELGETPREVLTLTTTRRRFAVSIDGTAMELCVDHVRAAEPHARRASFHELELELRSGDAAVLRELAVQLSKRAGLSASHRTKFERARASLGLGEFRYGAKAPSPDADALLVDAARAVVHAWWQTVLAHVPGVRVGLDPEHVHKMRVAMRRLRTALRVYEAAFDPEAGDDFRRRLRSFGRLLGQVRDYDVQREAIPAWRSAFVGIAAEAWADVDDRLVRRRHRARSQVLQAMRSEAWRELVVAAERCIASAVPGLRHTVGAAAAGLVATRVERCARAFARLRDDGDAEDAHALRIEIKNLRYTVEFFAPVLGPHVEEPLRAVTELQDRLGEVQDGVQTGRLAGELLVMPPPPVAATAAALGALVGHGHAMAQTARALGLAAADHVGLEAALAALR